MFSMSFNLFIIESCGNIDNASSQILKLHTKSMGFSDLWITTARKRDPKYK